MNISDYLLVKYPYLGRKITVLVYYWGYIMDGKIAQRNRVIE